MKGLVRIVILYILNISENKVLPYTVVSTRYNKLSIPTRYRKKAVQRSQDILAGVGKKVRLLKTLNVGFQPLFKFFIIKTLNPPYKKNSFIFKYGFCFLICLQSMLEPRKRIKCMATAIGSRYHVGNTSSRKNTEVKQGLDVDPVLVPTNTVKSQKRRNGRKKRIKCKLKNKYFKILSMNNF